MSLIVTSSKCSIHGSVNDPVVIDCSIGSHEPLPLHTDGFAYGALACDHFLLSCVIDGDTGGESVLVDGYRMIDDLATTDPELHRFVTEVDIDQTEPDMHPFVAPLAHHRASGRRIVRRPGFILPAPGSADPEHDRAMMRRWSDLTEAHRVGATRLTVDVAGLDLDDSVGRHTVRSAPLRCQIRDRRRWSRHGHPDLEPLTHAPSDGRVTT